MTATFPIFDGHNDILQRLLLNPERREAIWIEGWGGQLDLSRMAAGGFAGGLFAINLPWSADTDFDGPMANPPYDLALPGPVALDKALAEATTMAGLLLWMERSSDGRFRLCSSVSDLRDCLAKGVISGVMHMEGAEAIDARLDNLHLFHKLGLRSLGPVWSRPTIFGHGVPFRFPGSPDTGDGLTAVGKALVRECNTLGILIDLSHLNEKGFDDVAAISDAPLVATHSNAHSICASTRNLTDRQLDIIRSSGGLVGLNFATGFLREDGRRVVNTPIETVLRHLDHLILHLGEDHVGFGSDFDGAMIPEAIGDAAGLPNLVTAMQAHGYDEALMRKLCYENWFSILERTWKGRDAPDGFSSADARPRNRIA